MGARSDTHEAKRILRARARCPRAVALAEQLYGVADGLPHGAVRDKVLALGWSVDDAANRGRDLTTEHAGEIVKTAETLMLDPARSKARKALTARINADLAEGRTSHDDPFRGLDAL